LPSFTDRTAAARHDATSLLSCLRRERVAVRTLITTLLAGARERAGPRGEAMPRPHAAPPVEGYGSRRKDRAFDLPPLSSFQELLVTAYLIALALAGLLAIAIWECLE
jgi:hypothetical protein